MQCQMPACMCTRILVQREFVAYKIQQERDCDNAQDSLPGGGINGGHGGGARVKPLR